MKQRIVPSLVLGAVLVVAAASSTAQTPLTLDTVQTGLGALTDITAPPGDEDRLFLVNQSGIIKILDLRTRTVLSPDFLNIDPKVQSGGERGLLGLEFHKNYASNGFFYVNYTDNGGDTVVERYSVSATDPNQADPNSGSMILGPIFQPFSNHNGGQIRFGPDGYLYIGLGDGGSFDDPACRAQTGTELLGKMLRLDVDSASPYAIPASNPFVGDPNVLDEIWALGLRNPWRFSFDRETGDLYIADVGQDAKEEVDFQAASSTGGENYGWKIMEGRDCYLTGNCPPGIPPCDDPALTTPIKQYNHQNGCSITGGYVYRGCAIPDLRGTYFYADYCDDRVWSFRYDGVTKTEDIERTAELDPGGILNAITTFGEDGCGEIYIGTETGALYKIVANVTPPGTDLGFGKVGGNGLVPELSLCGLTDSANSALLRLRFAPPSAFMLLFISDQANPTNALGGTLVPVPPIFVLVLPTSPAGELEGPIPGGAGPLVLNFQFLIQDFGASFNTGFSNALEVRLDP